MLNGKEDKSGFVLTMVIVNWRNIPISLIDESVWLVRQQTESTLPDLPAFVRAIAISIELGLVKPYPVNRVSS